MTEPEVDALMANAERRFNSLKVDEGALREKLVEIDTELKQLQGKNSVYVELKKSFRALDEAVSSEGQVGLELHKRSDPAIVTPDPFKAKAVVHATK